MIKLLPCMKLLAEYCKKIIQSPISILSMHYRSHVPAGWSQYIKTNDKMRTRPEYVENIYGFYAKPLIFI